MRVHYPEDMKYACIVVRYSPGFNAGSISDSSGLCLIKEAGQQIRYVNTFIMKDFQNTTAAADAQFRHLTRSTYGSSWLLGGLSAMKLW